MSDQIYNTIAKVLDGEATEAEQQELQQWLAADEAHQIEYNELKAFWQKAEDMLQEQPAFDTGAAWSAVAAKTLNKLVQTEPVVTNQAPKKVIAFPNWMKLSVAAAAAIIIGVLVFRQTADTGMTTVIASNGNQEVVLPDNSHITLRQGSTLKYPEQFAANERHVMLEGEAFFEVTRNEQKPFTIDAQAATVQVLGTSFDVKSGADDATVTVATGKVKMALSADAGKAVILTPGERGKLQNGKLTEHSVSTKNYLFWKTGILDFTDKPLAEAVAELSEVTNTSIRIELTEAQKQQKISNTFNNESFEDMLSQLCMISSTQWSKEGNAYTIKQKNG